MGNCVARTNWFSVTDPNKLMQTLAKVKVEAGTHLQIFTKDENGAYRFVFGCEGEIKGFDCGSDDEQMHPFLEELREIVAEGDAIILQEVRHDKLRYVAAGAYIVTREKWDFIDFAECVLAKACEVTGNPKFKVELEY